METVRLDKENIAEALRRALETLERGGVVAYPTETFYALGAGFDREEALERIYRLKGRPREKAVSLIVGGMEAVDMVASSAGSAARALMERFWPGPVTLLLPARRGLSEFITAGGRVAVRAPGESFALRLARAAGFPITATSANPSGEPPAGDADMVREYFPRGLDLLIDGGEAPGGLPSAVVDTTGEGVRILRHGEAIIAPEDFETA